MECCDRVPFYLFIRDLTSPRAGWAGLAYRGEGPQRLFLGLAVYA